MQEAVYFSWRDIEVTAKRLSDRIKSHIELRFLDLNRIVPLGRGGLVPARLVSKYLKLERVDLSTYGYQNAIIIDDIYDTGQTIDRLRSNMTHEEVTTSIVGVLFTKVAKEKLDNERIFYGHELRRRKDKWIVFPWEDGIEKKVLEEAAPHSTG